MPVEQVTDLLIPYWQAAGYDFDATGDRAWLEQIAALVAPSLVRLEDAVAMTQYLFVADVGFTEAATAQLQQENVGAALTAIQSALEQTSSLTEATIQDIIQQGVKSANVKKGLVMRSLRAALTGDMQGPDLVQSWLLLHQRQFDINRLKQALTVAETIAG